MLSNFIRNNNKVTNSVTAEQFLSQFGSGNSVDISKSNAMKNSEIIFACVNLIANSIARMPINLFKKTEKGKEKVDNELSLLLKRRPNAFMTPFDFKKYIIVQVLTYGEAFVWIKTQNGKPVGLLPLDSSVTKIEKNNGTYWVVTKYNDKIETLKYETVLHFRDISNDCYGKQVISRVDVAIEKLSIIKNGDKMIENLFKNGGATAIKGALTTQQDLSGEAKLLLKQAFMNIVNNNGNGIAVLDGGLEYKDFGTKSMTLQDQQFNDSQKYNREAVCSVFGINSALIGATENTNYSNMTQIQRQFIESLTPFVVNMEEEMSYKLIPSYDQDNYYIKVNLNSAMRDDATERANFYKTMVSSGLMTVGECRDLEELSRINGTEDLLLMNLNFCPLDKYNEYLEKRYGANNTEENTDTEEVDLETDEDTKDE